MSDSPPTDFVAAIGGHPLVAQLLWQRGLRSSEAARAFLDPRLYAPASPFELPGMREAADRLSAAASAGERIRVWGDFDVDGQTSTSVLLLGLRALGAAVDYTIPNRATASHGLNEAGIRQAQQDGVTVLLSCDCGVTDFDEVELAGRLGLDVVITDHHDLGERLPAARAVVNPKRLPSDHRLANLPGVGVAFKLIEALAGGPGSAAGLLDLVALGIVADIAFQQADTRYLLQLGLDRLRAAPRLGVRALMRAAGLDPRHLDAEDIGFQIGPRLNAAGRLDSAELAVRLLTTDDPQDAQTLAARIESLNDDRRVVQRKVEDEALRQIERDPGLLRAPALVLSAPDWQPSVIGVVASSLAGRFKKPAVLISVEPGKSGRGSARGVEGVDVHAAIAANKDLVLASGGHPMAAGFGIRAESVPAFRDAINAHIAGQLERGAAGRVEATAAHDAVAAWREAGFELCEQLERLAPFGPGNPRPVLLSPRLRAVRAEPLGKDGRHRALFLQDDSGHLVRALWWRSADKSVPDQPVDVTYTLHRDVYQGKVRAQVHVEAILDHRAAGGEAGPLALASFTVLDRRAVADREDEVRRIRAEYGAENVRVFAESDAIEDGVTRLGLTPAAVLVLCDAPPGPDVLADILRRSAPQTVIMLSAPARAGRDAAPGVLQAVAGMLKTAAARGETVDDDVIGRMAARIGQRVETVQACVEIVRDGSEPSRDSLVHLLEETRGYRLYFHTAAAEAVLRR